MNSSKLWIALLARFEKAFRFLLLVFVSSYRMIGSPSMGGACRFTPSCSTYAMQALHAHPSYKAAWLITKRVCNCRPGGGCGFDPVPPAGGLS